MKNNLLDHRFLTIKVLYNVRSFEYLMHVVSEGGEKGLAGLDFFKQATST